MSEEHNATETETKQEEEKLTPIDFSQKWEMSDVAVRCPESEEILYVNKTILAIHSPFFKALFFGKFAESLQDVVDIEIDRDVMLEVLKIIHNSDRNFKVKGHTLYTPIMLARLHRAGDEFDIPIIRELFWQQFSETPSKDAFEIAIDLGLHKQKTEALKNMESADIMKYLNRGITELVLSPADAAIIVKKVPGTVSPDTVRCLSCGSSQVYRV